MIRAVTFDFWGTTYVEGPAAARRRELRVQYAHGFFTGMGAQVAEQQLEYGLEIVVRQIDHARHSRHAGLDAAETGRLLADAVGLRLRAEEARRLGELLSSAGREAPPVPAPGALEVLQSLHGSLRLGLISDTGLTLGYDLYAVMEADGIAQLFDHFTFSDQTGTTKPEVRQFHHTLYRLGCEPQEAVHVGDLESTDIVGAKQAGMRAIRILHPRQDHATTADAAIKAMDQLLEILRRWGAPV
ncbi:MAG: hypothetical protein B1H04_05065 [Planctomycetales bacterium 4484_123]|nr:MAG: hypothetical protein B1H04_05065 [Planctomycetales bacterium 4484_123]